MKNKIKQKLNNMTYEDKAAVTLVIAALFFLIMGSMLIISMVKEVNTKNDIVATPLDCTCECHYYAPTPGDATESTIVYHKKREILYSTTEEVTSEVRSTTQHQTTEVTYASPSDSTPISGSIDEIELLARVVFGEAGNQDEMGKRLVIDCVLNRVGRRGFSNSITGVLYQPGQFTVVNRLSRFPVDEGICNLIREEMSNRTNSEVLYFRPRHYHNFGTPLFQHGAHYFSK